MQPSVLLRRFFLAVILRVAKSGALDLTALGFDAVLLNYQPISSYWIKCFIHLASFNHFQLIDSADGNNANSVSILNALTVI